MVCSYYRQLHITLICFGAIEGSQKDIPKQIRKVMRMKDQTMTLNGNVRYRGVRGEFKSSVNLYGEGINVELLKASVLQYLSMCLF